MQRTLLVFAFLALGAAQGWLIYEARSARAAAEDSRDSARLALDREKRILPATFTSTVCCNGVATQLTTTGTIEAHRAEVAKADTHCTSTGGTTDCP